jgi:hypothetical protein
MVMGSRQLIVAVACVLKVGVALAAPTFWAARTGSDGAVIRTSKLPDCRVHIATGDGSETLHACGAPVPLPPRAVAVWIEQGNAVSAQIAPPDDSRAVDLALVPAGTVQLDVEPGNAELRTIRLFHVGSVRFSRTLTVGAAGQRLQMPLGTALALEIDNHGDVSRFAEGRVGAGKTTEMRPAVPAQAAALVGVFSVPDLVRTTDHPAAFLLNGDTSAELVIDHGNEIVTLWRGMAAGPATLTLRSRTYQLPPASLRLRERGVATIRAELRPLPSLTVRIDVPESAQAAWQALEPSLTIRRTEDKKVVRQSGAPSTSEFPFLPVDSYDAVLTAKPWTFVRRADLTNGTDDVVDFSPEPFKISGRILAGDEPKAASVTFRRGNGDSTSARSDSNGEYEVTLWMRDMYIVETVLDESVAQPPFSRVTRISSTRRLDIHVPITRVLVRVTDATSNEPVAGADVTTFNRWDHPDSGKGTASHTVTTDAGGIAHLAPLSPGTAEIHVKAAGYFKDEPTIIAVQEDVTERTVAVKVRPAGASSVVRLTLPTGGPASEAELVAVGDTGGWQTLWSGRSDAEGRAEVPRSLAGSIILVRHPAAAGFARRFQDLPEQDYRLTAASPQPLLVKVERRGDPSQNAAITVWFGGLPLTGAALQFLVRSPAFVPSSGLWTGQNLPREPVRILASSGTIDAQIAAGAYDALATVVPEARPNQLTLEVVD